MLISSLLHPAPRRLLRVPIVLLTLVLAVAAGCSDANTPAADGSASDAGLDLRADRTVGDLAFKPDLLAQTLPDLKNVTLVVNLGDSIAAGYGVQKSYADLLLQNDDATYPNFAGKDFTQRYPGVTLHDGAIPGATSDAMINQLGKVPANPSGETLVILSAGGNDLLFSVNVVFNADKVKEFGQHVAANIKKVIDHFSDTTRYPGGATVLFFNVYDPTDGLGTIPLDTPVVTACNNVKGLLNLSGKLLMKHLAIFNKELADFSATQPKGFVVDIRTGFLGHGYHHDEPDSPFYDSADPTLWFSFDCIHPNQAGQVGLRRLIWTLLYE